MKKIFFAVLSCFACFQAWASASYFQAPSVEASFGVADVYMSIDNALCCSVGDMSVSDSVRVSLLQNEIDKSLDYSGRYAVWDLIPEYVYAPEIQAQKARVDISVWDESWNLAQDGPDEDGAYNIKYKVRASVKISDNEGKILLQKDLGEVCGIEKSAQQQLSDNLPAASVMAISNAYRRARQEVYSLYGYGIFTVDAEPAAIENREDLNEKSEKIWQMLQEKAGLYPNSVAFDSIRSYAAVLENEMPSLEGSAKTAANFNLALAKAWTGDSQSASKALETYKSGMTSFADSARYYAVSQFVEHYAPTVKRYGRLYRVLDSNIYQLVNFYAYNDIISQVFDLPFPFPFLQYFPYTGGAQAVSGSITLAGQPQIQYNITLNSKGYPSKLTVQQVREKDEYGRTKFKTNDLYINYDRSTGNFKGISTVPGSLVRLFMPFAGMSKEDSLAMATSFTTQNILGSFMKMKVATTETAAISLDASGMVHISGSTISSHPLFLFTSLAEHNGIEFPVSFSEFSSEFASTMDFGYGGAVTAMNWQGKALYEKNRGDYNYAFISGDSINSCMQIVADSVSSYVSYNMKAKVKTGWNVRPKWAKPGLFGGSEIMTVTPVNNNEAWYEIEVKWPVKHEYDEKGNWTKVEMGPYIFERQLVYDTASSKRK